MSRATITAFSTEKGGVGKSTCVFHGAAEYTFRGRKVLAIDLDRQGNITKSFVDSPPEKHTIFEVLVDDLPIEEAIVETRFQGIDLVPASRKLDDLDANIATKPDGLLRLQDALQPLIDSSRYDHILLDCPGHLGLATRNAMVAAHNVVLPLEPSRWSIDGLDSLLQLIRQTQATWNPDLDILGIVLTRVDGRQAAPKQLEARLRDENVPVFQTVLAHLADFNNAVTANQPLRYYNANSKATRLIAELINEIEKHGKHHYAQA